MGNLEVLDHPPWNTLMIFYPRSCCYCFWFCCCCCFSCSSAIAYPREGSVAQEVNFKIPPISLIATATETSRSVSESGEQELFRIYSIQPNSRNSFVNSFRNEMMCAQSRSSSRSRRTSPREENLIVTVIHTSRLEGMKEQDQKQQLN